LLALYATNVAAAVRYIQGFLSAMRASGWGRIVQIGTGEAVNRFRPCLITQRPRPRCSTSRPRWPSTWTAPDHGQHGQPRQRRHAWRTGVLRLETRRRGWGQDWSAIEAGVLTEVLGNPTGRLGRPEEVADRVAFVTSPLVGYINGTNLRIDGGSTAAA
jgi:3-oxoacyl-[acyl-carrier protein] reductase